MSFCQQALTYICMALGTMVVCWILLWEARHYRDQRKDKWYDKDLW